MKWSRALGCKSDLRIAHSYKKEWMHKYNNEVFGIFDKPQKEKTIYNKSFCEFILSNHTIFIVLFSDLKVIEFFQVDCSKSAKMQICSICAKYFDFFFYFFLDQSEMTDLTNHFLSFVCHLSLLSWIQPWWLWR